MFITDDPIADFHRHDAEQSEWLDSLPKCVDCDEPIQDDCYYNVEGEILCEECMKDRYRKRNHF